MKIKIPKFLKPNRLKKIKKHIKNSFNMNREIKRMENAKRKRNEKKITDKIGFEYKDRKKVW
jgi:hypothetical protein